MLQGVMLRMLVAVGAVGIVVGVSARQAPPAPATPPAASATTQDAGRGGRGAVLELPPILAAPEVPPPAVGTAAISGVVTDASTGAPLEGAVVSLTGGGTPGQPMNRPRQMTDSKGRFIFPQLPASPTYSLYASRTGFLDSGFQRIPRLDEGQWYSEARIKLSRLGAISGSVIDERGEPMVGVPIRILLGATVAGRLRWASGALTQTDDRGMYRFAGLSKGRYVVHVPSIQITLPSGEVALYRAPTQTTAGAPPPNQMRELLHVVRGQDGSGLVSGVFAEAPPDEKGSVYASVFHPAARSIDQAEPIALESSADRTGVDVQMTPVPSVSVSGTVAGPTNLVAGIPVRILPTGNEMLGQAGDAGLTKADATGRFTFHRIPAGDYLIVVSRSVTDYRVLDYSGNASVQERLPVGANPFVFGYSFSPRNGTVLESRMTREVDVTGRLQVNVGNRALSGLVVPVAPTVNVSGHLEWDGSETPPAALLQSLVLVGLEPADGDVTLGQYQVRAMTNGPGTRMTFTFENIKAGRYVLADPRVVGNSYRLVGAAWNGRDIVDTPLAVSAEGPVTGIVLQMSAQFNKVTGTARLADGRVATDGAVFAFPVSSTAWLESGLSAIRFRTAPIVADGTYELPPILPGDYFLAAVSMEDRDRWVEPAFLASIARQATRVSIGAGSTLSQNLRVVGGQR